MNKEIIYPQYRKYENNKVYFKIISTTEWDEIHIRNKKYVLEKFIAKILPDRNYIYDLTFDYKNNWLAIDEIEYQGILKKINSTE